MAEEEIKEPKIRWSNNVKTTNNIQLRPGSLIEEYPRMHPKHQNLFNQYVQNSRRRRSVDKEKRNKFKMSGFKGVEDWEAHIIGTLLEKFTPCEAIRYLNTPDNPYSKKFLPYIHVVNPLLNRVHMKELILTPRKKLRNLGINGLVRKTRSNIFKKLQMKSHYTEPERLIKIISDIYDINSEDCINNIPTEYNNTNNMNSLTVNSSSSSAANKGGYKKTKKTIKRYKVIKTRKATRK